MLDTWRILLPAVLLLSATAAVQAEDRLIRRRLDRESPRNTSTATIFSAQ